jgi:hypothetical protein
MDYNSPSVSGERRNKTALPTRKLQWSKRTTTYPCLDMKLYWDKKENLAFTVYQKLGQQLKYLNKDSTDPPHVAIPLAVLSRLANLTSYDGTNNHRTMQDLHPLQCPGEGQPDL